MNEFFRFETGQSTDVGCKRTVNEDSHLSRADLGFWVVADGMGGHAAGDYASAQIIAELSSIGLAGSAEDLQARFMERLTRANAAILAHARELGGGAIGSTVVAVLVHGADYSCIWSGDSRAYLLREGQMQQISRDHTEVEALLAAGTISEEEARNWPRKNVITRAIGVAQQPQCDIVSGHLQPGDCFLLCSDGLNEHLSDADISQMLQGLPPQQACDAMVRETLARGAKDNVTVVVTRAEAVLDHPAGLEDALDDLP